MPSFLRSGKRLAIVSLVAGVLIAFPLVALAQTFLDVPSGTTYYNDVEALYAKGVTTGCGNNNYCPKDYVTREQMAAFMNRLGALGAGKTPVVNADKLDGKDSSDFLQTGDIVETYIGGWVLIHSYASAATVQNWGDGVSIVRGSAGTVGVQLPLVAPTTINGQAFAFKEANVCVNGLSSNVVLSAMTANIVNAASVNGGVADNTDHVLGSSACYPISTTPTSGTRGVTIQLILEFVGSGNAGLSITSVTWTPVP